MKYEESLANINKVGKSSICLELNPKFQPFLDALSNCYLDDLFRRPLIADSVYNVLMILAGECCEGDYVVTTDEDTTHDLDALEKVIDEHKWEFKSTREQLAVILKHFKECLWKRSVLWG